jgi:hypothetical protein
MTRWPDQPVIYEINTAVWLDELSRAAGRPVTLATVGAADWDAAVPAGVDAVWLMGVWGRSPAGLANANAELQASFAETLPDLRHADVIGSPYCVRRYVIDAGFSGWPDNQSWANLAAWSWAGERGSDRHVVVVNLSDQPAQARIPLDWPDLPGRSWQLTDILSQSMFERDRGELASPGLFVDLGPLQFHLLALR